MLRSFPSRAARLQAVSLLATLAGCGETPDRAVAPAPPPIVPPIAAARFRLNIGYQTPTHLVSGGRVIYWVYATDRGGSTHTPSNVVWENTDTTVARISATEAHAATVHAVAPGTTSLRAHTSESDTLRVDLTVHARPATLTRLEDSPMTVSGVDVMQRILGDRTLYIPLVTAAARTSQPIEVLEMSLRIPGIPQTGHCATRRWIREQVALFGQTDDDWEFYLETETSDRPTGPPVLELIALDAQGRSFRVAVEGALGDFDPYMSMQTRFREAPWNCTPAAR